jgi:hypothetical protein
MQRQLQVRPVVRQPSVGPATTADGVNHFLLKLQRSAGNRAVVAPLDKGHPVPKSIAPRVWTSHSVVVQRHPLSLVLPDKEELIQELNEQLQAPTPSEEPGAIPSSPGSRTKVEEKQEKAEAKRRPRQKKAVTRPWGYRPPRRSSRVLMAG